MAELRLAAVESRFADLIWSREPLTTGELVALCEEELHWKRSTTYTVLKRLCQRELFVTREGVVTSLVSREDFYAAQSERFVQETFHGSLPAFLAAFTARKSLTDKEIEEIKRMIDSYGEQGGRS